MGDREARIRDEAYRIWVEAGRPDGNDENHWREAERRIAESDRVEEAAERKLETPPSDKRPSRAAKEAAGAVAAPAKKGRVPDPKAADAKPKRAAPGSKPVEGASAAPAPGAAGAKPALKRGSAKRDG